MNSKKALLSCIFLTFMLAGCAGNDSSQEGKNSEKDSKTDSKSEYQVSEETISQEAKEAAKSYLAEDKASVLFFYVDWCPVCQNLKPVINKVEKEVEEDAKVVRINADDNPKVAKAFGVKSVPKLYFFTEKGEFSHSVVGSMSEEELMKQFDKVS